MASYLLSILDVGSRRCHIPQIPPWLGNWVGAQMSAIAGVVRPVFNGLGIIIGGIGAGVLNILMLFATPLNVIAFMHLFGWEWWTALIAVVLIGFVPVVGLLCCFVMPFVGAYFLVSAHFDLGEATTPRVKVVSAHATDYDKALQHYVARCTPALSSQGLPADKASAVCSCVFAGTAKAVEMGTEGTAPQRLAALMDAQPNPQGSAVERQIYGIVSGCFPQ